MTVNVIIANGSNTVYESFDSWSEVGRSIGDWAEIWNVSVISVKVEIVK
jgi:hypothetical protein